MSSVAIVISILIATTLILVGIGVALVKFKKMNSRTGARYAKICVLLVAGMGYWLCYAGLQLKTFETVSATITLSIVTYAVIFAAIAYQMNKLSHEQNFEESYMLSMIDDDATYLSKKLK
jgi:glucan phosphoethanolaminetransferase (alkaline phosphatase superfamily)